MAPTIRHIKRITDGSQTGAARQMLGQWFEPYTVGLNDDRGFQAGTYETRVYDEGRWSLVLPNGVANDAVHHLQRFLISKPGHPYRVGHEWVEIYDGADLLFVGTPESADATRSTLSLTGMDALYLLRKSREYYAGYWHHAPRDIWEHYTEVWKVYLAEDFSAGTVPADGRFTSSHTAAATRPGHVRIAPPTAGVEGIIAGASGSASQFTLGHGASNAQRFNFWQVKVQFARPRFGTEAGGTGGANAHVRVGLRNMTGPTDLLWIQLKERSSAVVVPDDTPGATGPATVQIPDLNTNEGTYEVIIEGRDRWIYFFVDQRLVTVVPMPIGPYTVTPFVGMVAGDTWAARHHVEVDNMLLRRCEPLLMRDTAQGMKGEYHLPAAPTQTGGLWGRYYDDDEIRELGDYAQRGFSPTTESVWHQRIDKQLAFISPEYTVSPKSTWQPEGKVGDDLWWSVRWTGSIYLDLANFDYGIRYSTQEEGARLWLGKTRMSEVLLDNWVTNLGVTQTNTSIRGHIPEMQGGGWASGWYPIVIEYGNRGTEGAEFHLEYKRGADAWATVPSAALSPLGVFTDQIRADSHYEAIRTIAEMYGYQFTVEPRALESGSFPGILRPRRRVGRDSDAILTADDVESFRVTIKAGETADAILGDGSGLADEESGSQVTAEGIMYDLVQAELMLYSAYEQFGDITSVMALAARIDSLLALHNSPWEEVGADPPGRRVLTDTFPLTGNMAMLNWQAGDGVRLDFPALGVEDTTPRQMLGVTRPFTPIMLGAPAITFKARPRSLREFIREMQRRVVRKQRKYQGQIVERTGTPGTSLQPSRVALPTDLSRISRITVAIYEAPDDPPPWRIYVNGVQTAHPEISKLGVYDITSYVERTFDTLSGEWLAHMEVEVKT